MTTELSSQIAFPERLAWRHPDALVPYERNPRTHTDKQIRQIMRSIERFGFTNPILIGADGGVVAGHGRLAAAKRLGLDRVPVLQLDHLSAEERRAYVIADNRLAELAGWDEAMLRIELEGLLDLDFDVELTGFATAEIDLMLEDGAEEEASDRLDKVPDAAAVTPRARFGQLWALGPHRLLCGDARSAEDVCRVMAGAAADLVFTDPPYNVPIAGHVSGKGRTHHPEFAFAVGEMSSDAFTDFLRDTLRNAAAVCRDGAIAFVCMDWRHMREVLDAGCEVFTELKNLCVWAKTNAGMGSFYRSRHELIFVFKHGRAPHTNTFGLGDTGRYRTNVWEYRGANSIGPERDEALAMHPTVKPVALVADAIRDCARHGDHVLDLFGGSGTTLIAAESCGRIAHLVEYEPHWCDTILARYEAATGDEPQLLGDYHRPQAAASECAGET